MNRIKARYVICIMLTSIILLGVFLFQSGQYNANKQGELKESSKTDTPEIPKLPGATKVAVTEVPRYEFVNANGDTLETRIKVPQGYERVEAKETSLLNFMRGLSLKVDQSKVLMFNGSESSNQSAHVAVFGLDVGERDLQQCADSIIRVFAEYYWKIEKKDKIAFHLTNGFLMEYSMWRQGYRLVVVGNDVKWSKKTGQDDSYESFRDYLTSVYTYAGTLSLSEEGMEIEKEDIFAGDYFIRGGSPGHCVLVVDVAVNAKGEKCVLLAQGYLPARDFHVIKNLAHEEDPWYYVSELSFPLKTPSWTFEEESLRRWTGLE